MCIVCDMQKLNQMHADAAGSLVQTLAESTHELIEVLAEFRSFYSASSDRGAAIDAKAATMIDKATRVLSGVGEPAEEQRPTREGIVEALKQAFPGAQVIVGSPDEVEAMIDKATNSGKKTH